MYCCVVQTSATSVSVSVLPLALVSKPYILVDQLDESGTQYPWAFVFEYI